MTRQAVDQGAPTTSSDKYINLCKMRENKNFSSAKIEVRGIAQLGERLNGIQEVSGSIPLISTKTRPQSLGFVVLIYLKENENSDI